MGLDIRFDGEFGLGSRVWWGFWVGSTNPRPEPWRGWIGELNFMPIKKILNSYYQLRLVMIKQIKCGSIQDKQ